MRRLTTVLFLGFFLAGAGPTLAHKVIISAYKAGNAIEGEVGFSNGDMAADSLIEVFAPDGRKLGETRTDADGMFVFTPTEAIAHTFKSDLGAGHVAETTLGIDELPAGLSSSDTPAPATSDEPASSRTQTAQAAVSDSAPGREELRAMIAEAVRDEVRPLRREISTYKEHINIQNILGGIGYIVGLCGVVFYMLARRRFNASS